MPADKAADMPATTHAPGQDAYGPVPETLEFWCGDCRQICSFEAVVASDSPATAGEWACTTCGAAYIEGDFDVAATMAPVVRGVA